MESAEIADQLVAGAQVQMVRVQSTILVPQATSSSA
jgi:hypothetical protein